LSVTRGADPLPARILRRGGLVLAALFLLTSPALADQAVPGAERSADSALAGVAGLLNGPPPPAPPDVIARDAEGRATIRAVRVSGPMQIDGALDEALYASPAMTDFVQVEPQLGDPATEKTEVWMGFDGDNVYISFRCWDSQPDRRVTKDMRRDGSAMFSGDDVVYFFIDTFYDRRNGATFTINSLGGRSDGQVTGDQYNGDWNPIYDLAAGRFEGGWTVEVALPFKSLRYRAGEAQLWGFNASRTVRWRNEISVLVPVPPWRGLSAARQAQLAGTVVGIEAPSGSKNLEIKPYAVSSVSTNRTVSPRVLNDVTGDVGMDLKYGLTQNLVADFTYNTDFAQVEADEQQVNLTRFSLFFPEKREFFLENQGTFAFGGTAASQGTDVPILFYSRRIGLNGNLPVAIDGGGRLTGRAGRYSIGLLDIQTDDAPLAPATNFSAVRVKRDVLRRSSVGLLYTGRSVSQLGTGRNAAYGVDGVFNFFNYLTISSYWARTDTGALASGDDTSYRGQLDYVGDRYGVQIGHLAVGSRFNPEVGYVRRADIRRSNAEFRFSPRLDSSDRIRKLSWTAGLAYVEDGMGRPEARDRDGEFAIEFENADRFAVAYAGAYEFVPRPFRIASNVFVPSGGYDYDTASLTYTTGPQRRITGNLRLDYGTFYSGKRTSLSATRGRLSFGPKFFVEPSYSVNWVELDEGDFTTHLAGGRVTYTATSRMFVSALLQYNSDSELVSTNARLRWEYRPGSELFVVYNDERDARTGGFPALATRSLIVKVNRLIRF
jgi:hypothetical protein